MARAALRSDRSPWRCRAVLVAGAVTYHADLCAKSATKSLQGKGQLQSCAVEEEGYADAKHEQTAICLKACIVAFGVASTASHKRKPNSKQLGFSKIS